MGYNTTVIVLNDALHAIKDDPEFGKKLAAAVSHVGCYGQQKDVSALGHVNAATVVETHHADGNAIVAVGGNCATRIGFSFGTHHNHDDTLKIVKELANQLGYSLRKKAQR